MLLGKGEAEQIVVLLNSILMIRLWNDCDLSLERPFEQYLAWRFADSGSDILDHWHVVSGLLFLGIAEFDVGWCAQAAVASYLHAHFVAESNELWLSIQWMELDLEDGWFDLSIRPDISDERSSHIADTDSLDLTLFLESLHGSPSFVHWNQINE